MKQHQLSAVAIAALVCCMHSKTFAQTDWHITGNGGTNATNNFVGTTDNVPLAFRTNNAIRMRINGNGNIGIGTTAPFQKLDVNGNINLRKGFALYAENHPILRVDSAKGNTFLGNGTAPNVSGSDITAVGYQALFSNTSGSWNTALGFQALYANYAGFDNVAVGYIALNNNTSANGNTAIGNYALLLNNGNYNTATGTGALLANTSGTDNVANGRFALYDNSTGSYNTALGTEALNNNTASYNTATGYRALYANTTGYDNSAHGWEALYYNSTGIYNTAQGLAALYSNTTGNYNTAVGTYALFNTPSSSYNTAVGDIAGSSYQNGWNNVFVGANTDVNAAGYYNVIAIGQGTICTNVSQARIGNSATSSIGGYANWTNISDVRVKKNIKQNVPGLAFINKLQPITYNLNLEVAEQIIQPPVAKDKEGKVKQPTQQELDSKKAKEQIVYTGFAAQDVEKAAKELNFDFSGVDAAKNDKDLYGLRYAEFVVPLVKAVQELSQQNEEMKNKIEKLEAVLSQNNSGSVSATASTNVTITDASLGQNTPNPFNRNTTISYTLPQSRQGGTSAQIMISDQNGKVVKQVNISGAGKGVVNVDASALSSGTYTYALVVDGKRISSKQMILTK
jgi:trimeric autotransporter adhesin